MANDVQRNKVVILNNNDILPNRFQPRKYFDEEEILQLSESIKEHGVINPIIVRKLGDKYELVAGERRYKANILAGNDDIPAIIMDINDKESSEIAVVENVQRKDLNAIEEAISYKRILDIGYMTQDQLAHKMGKSQSAIANKIRLLKLTDEVQDALMKKQISERHARSLLKIESNNKQNEMLSRIINERLTVRQTDEEIEKMNNNLNNFDQSINSNQNVEVIPTISMNEANSQVNNGQVNNSMFINNEPWNMAPIQDSTPMGMSNMEMPNTTPIQETTVAPTSNIEMPSINPIQEESSFAAPNIDFPNIASINNSNESSNMDIRMPNISSVQEQEPIPTPHVAMPNIASIQDSTLESTRIPNVPPIENQNNFSNMNMGIPNTAPIQEIEQNPTPNVAMPNVPPIQEENLDIPVSVDSINNNSNDIENNEYTANLFNQPIDSNNSLNSQDSLSSEVLDNNPTNMFEQATEPIITTDYNYQYDPVMPNVQNQVAKVDFKEIINLIRNCSDQIERNGYKIEVEEYDLANLYQVVFKIDKQ